MYPFPAAPPVPPLPWAPFSPGPPIPPRPFIPEQPTFHLPQPPTFHLHQPPAPQFYAPPLHTPQPGRDHTAGKRKRANSPAQQPRKKAPPAATASVKAPMISLVPQSLSSSAASYLGRKLEPTQRQYAKAAGILPIRIEASVGKVFVLLASECREPSAKSACVLTVCGGKRKEADGAEPASAAYREFTEETGGYLGDDFKQRFMSMHAASATAAHAREQIDSGQMVFWFAKGKYVLHLYLSANEECDRLLKDLDLVFAAAAVKDVAHDKLHPSKHECTIQHLSWVDLRSLLDCATAPSTHSSHAIQCLSLSRAPLSQPALSGLETKDEKAQSPNALLCEEISLQPYRLLADMLLEPSMAAFCKGLLLATEHAFRQQSQLAATTAARPADSSSAVDADVPLHEALLASLPQLRGRFASWTQLGDALPKPTLTMPLNSHLPHPSPIKSWPTAAAVVSASSAASTNTTASANVTSSAAASSAARSSHLASR